MLGAVDEPLTLRWFGTPKSLRQAVEALARYRAAAG
jgi:hypothetical protein